jgi:hypothetical protein
LRSSPRPYQHGQDPSPFIRPLGATLTALACITLTPDGEYIVAGTTRPNVALEPDHVYLARYLE